MTRVIHGGGLLNFVLRVLIASIFHAGLSQPGEANFEDVATKKVLVVGAGGLGECDRSYLSFFFQSALVVVLQNMHINASLYDES